VLRDGGERNLRDYLIDTAARLIAERGTAGLAVRDITRAAQVADGVLYNYFEDKEDLLAHACICLVRGRHVFDNWTFVGDKTPLDVQVRGALLTNNAEVLHGWILDGHGIGLKALWDIEDDLEAGRLVEVLAPFAHDTINLYLNYPTRSHLPGRVRVFIDFIVDAVGKLQRLGAT